MLLKLTTLPLKKPLCTNRTAFDISMRLILHFHTIFQGFYMIQVALYNW